MARQPRFDLLDQPHHVIQRGNNRVPIFNGASDYLYFKSCLLAGSKRHACDIHAYVLMTNHFHLLVTPRGLGVIGRLLQSVGRRYVRYFNDRNQRSGTLWEGRYRASVIDSDRYLFACYRYIEANPVRAGMVDDPARYPWLSFLANATGVTDPLVTPHDGYVALGSSPASRQRSYRAICAAAEEEPLLARIRSTVHGSWALGDEPFQRGVDEVGRRAGPLPAGRPRTLPQMPPAATWPPWFADR